METTFRGYVTGLNSKASDLHGHRALLVDRRRDPRSMFGGLAATANGDGMILHFQDADGVFTPLSQEQAESMKLNEWGEFEIPGSED